MRFAITAVDRYLGVFESFVRAGWEPVKLFTVPLRDPIFGNQQATITYAEKHNIPVQITRMTEDDLADLRAQECDALIVASYDWRIPDTAPFLKYAINFHASPLPDGRGAYPVPRAILEKRETWAVTCHQLTTEIDNGAILAKEHFPLRADECHESLDLKIQMAAKKLAAKVATQFVPLWDAAMPQQVSDVWPKTKMTERVIDFTQPVEDILRHVRAFGGTGSVANINGTWLIVKRAVGWDEAHDHITGSVVHVYNGTIIVAATQGFIALLDSDIAASNVVAQL